MCSKLNLGNHVFCRTFRMLCSIFLDQVLCHSKSMCLVFCLQKKCCTCFLFYFLSNYNLKDVSELPKSDTILAMTIENRMTKRNERYIIFITHLFFRFVFTFFRIQLFNSLLFSIKHFLLNEKKNLWILLRIIIEIQIIIR